MPASSHADYFHPERAVFRLDGVESYLLRNQVFSFCADLPLAIVASAFTFGEFVEQRGEHEQWKLGGPGEFLKFCLECDGPCVPLPKEGAPAKKSIFGRLGDTLRITRKK